MDMDRFLSCFGHKGGKVHTVHTKDFSLELSNGDTKAT